MMQPTTSVSLSDVTSLRHFARQQERDLQSLISFDLMHEAMRLPCGHLIDADDADALRRAGMACCPCCGHDLPAQDRLEPCHATRRAAHRHARLLAQGADAAGPDDLAAYFQACAQGQTPASLAYLPPLRPPLIPAGARATTAPATTCAMLEPFAVLFPPAQVPTAAGVEAPAARATATATPCPAEDPFAAFFPPAQATITPPSRPSPAAAVLARPRPAASRLSPSAAPFVPSGGRPSIRPAARVLPLPLPLPRGPAPTPPARPPAVAPRPLSPARPAAEWTPTLIGDRLRRSLAPHLGAVGDGRHPPPLQEAVAALCRAVDAAPAAAADATSEQAPALTQLIVERSDFARVYKRVVNIEEALRSAGSAAASRACGRRLLLYLRQLLRSLPRPRQAGERDSLYRLLERLLYHARSSLGPSG